MAMATECAVIRNLIQNSPTVKKVCGPVLGKKCEILSGGQEMAVIVG